MKKHALELMDTLAAICEHRFFGLLIWVGIAVSTALDNKLGVALGVTLKTYLSGTWIKKGLNGNDKNSNGTVPAVGSGVHVSEHKSTGNPV